MDLDKVLGPRYLWAKDTEPVRRVVAAAAACANQSTWPQRDDLRDRVATLNRELNNMLDIVREHEATIANLTTFAQDRADYAARLAKENETLQKRLDKIQAIAIGDAHHKEPGAWPFKSQFNSQLP